MKRAYLLAALAAAMMMTACGGGEENGSKNRTTTSTTVSEADISGQETSSLTETVTQPPQDSSAQDTQTQPTADTSSQPDDESSKEPETPAESPVKCEGSRIMAADFGIDITYPGGWNVKGYDAGGNETSTTVATVMNEDLGVSSTVELISFEGNLEEGRQVTADEYLKSLRQAYTELTAPDDGDPMSVSDVDIQEGSTGKAKTVSLSYTQRGVKSYLCTYVYQNEKKENSFLQFSYAFSDSDNTEHIKKALDEMMG